MSTPAERPASAGTALPTETMTRRGPRRATVAAALLLILGIWGGLSPAAPAARAQAPDTTHLQTVRAEYGIMMSSYVRPLAPSLLLNAAWTGATDFLRQNGVAA